MRFFVAKSAPQNDGGLGVRWRLSLALRAGELLVRSVKQLSLAIKK
jgi:hypothetical protein